jgi:curved DNA-binding protein CbpA
MDESQFKVRIEQIFADLDRYSYYELLNLTPEAAPDDIRAAFHRMALSVHPDRFHNHPDLDLRGKVYTIYKRMTEGYRVLMDSSSRREYDQNLGDGQVRLQQVERKRTGPKRTEDTIDHPQAKKFFQLALAAERKGDLKSAKLNCKFALDLAGEHPTIQAKLAALEKASEKP